MKTLKCVLLLVVALGFLPAAAQSDPDPCFPPKPAQEDRLVFQFTPFLSPQQEAQLNAKLVRFAQETSNRIAVVAVDTLCGYPPSDFAFQLGEYWGFGKKGVDNGVLILVKPNGAAGDRHVFIAVGYGLEGAIPDLTAKRVVEEEILPRFRNGDLYGGMDRATSVLMGLAKGEIDAKSYGEEPMPWLPILAMLAFFAIIVLSSIQRARRYARVNHLDFWTAWAMMTAASSNHGGSWGGFSGGGGGGGGFGGFGGGSFGGGGAGGSW